jgi:hypothetical protein
VTQPRPDRLAHLRQLYADEKMCVRGSQMDDALKFLFEEIDRLADAPAVDRAALRDRIADILAAADEETWADGYDKTQSAAYQGYQKRADAVLAVLPAPADRADETPQPTEPVRVETLARLLCDADTTLTDGPSWDRLSQTPGLGRDEYRNAARYLLRRVTVTQALDGPAVVLCGDQIPGMTCTLPDGPHDDWKHRDEEGHWWSQMRVAPYSNRDRLADEQPAIEAQPGKEA